MLTYIQQHREEVYREQGNRPKTQVLQRSLAAGEESLPKK